MKNIMTTYTLEALTINNYHEMMSGNPMLAFPLIITLEANSKEEAITIAKAQYKGYVINEKYVLSAEEIAEREVQKIAREEQYRLEEEAKAIRRANNELAKAEAMGMTLEEYKEYKKEIANRKRYETEIKKAKAEIEALQKKIAYYEKKLK